MEKYFNVLRECPLFAGLADEHILKILTCMGAKAEFFDKNSTVIPEGSKAKHIGIVLSGSVRAIHIDYFGNRNIVSAAGVSELFGEAFSCAEIPAVPVSIVTSEPSAVLLLDCSHILHTCHRNCFFHGDLIYNLMRNLAKKNLEMHKKLEITSKRTTRDKLLTYLNFEAKKQKKNAFDIPFDRQELADYLVVDRSGLSAEISKLRREGIIECKRNHFELK